MINRLPNRKARHGFTLTEMLVVVAIIVVLAAVAVPITMTVLTTAKIDIATAQMKGPIRTAVFDYARRYGKDGDYATNSQMMCPDLGGKGLLSPDVANDPWGNPYQIEYSVQDPDAPVFTMTSGGPGGNSPIQVSSSQLPQ